MDNHYIQSIIINIMHLQVQKHHNIQTYPLKNLYHIPLNIIPVYQAYEPVTIRGMFLQASYGTI